jgi:trans-aconitate methyltransferase
MSSTILDSGVAASPAAYITDLRYPSAFVFGQTPLQMVWAAAAAGAPTRPLNEPFVYCDLGCGDGITLNVLAAEYPEASFIGVDLNAGHLAIARDMAGRAGLDNIVYLQASFSEAQSAGLPPLDFIAIHGVYSWIDAGSRSAIHDFASRQLKPGGLLCVQYSCLPGSSVHDPLFNFLRAFADRASGASAERFTAGVEALRKIAPHSRFFAANPQTEEIMRSFARHPVGTWAHDVLNRRLHSDYFHEVCDAFSALGLEFMGNGNLKMNHPELMMTRDAYAIYKEITAGAGIGSLAGLWLQPVAAACSIEARRRASTGTAVDLSLPLYSAVLDVCASEAATIDTVLNAPGLDDFGRAEIETAIAQLYMMRCMNVLILPPRAATYRSDRRYRLGSALNRILLEATLFVPEAIAFASPVLGSALKIPADARLRLLAFLGGDLRSFWQELQRQNRRIVDGSGNPVTTFERFREQTEAALPAFAANAVPELLRFGLLEEAG